MIDRQQSQRSSIFHQHLPFSQHIEAATHATEPPSGQTSSTQWANQASQLESISEQLTPVSGCSSMAKWRSLQMTRATGQLQAMLDSLIPSDSLVMPQRTRWP